MLTRQAVDFVDVLVIKDLIKHASGKKKGGNISYYLSIIFSSFFATEPFLS